MLPEGRRPLKKRGDVSAVRVPIVDGRVSVSPST
jgi:hypothetical protein